MTNRRPRNYFWLILTVICCCGLALRAQTPKDKKAQPAESPTPAETIVQPRFDLNLTTLTVQNEKMTQWLAELRQRLASDTTISTANAELQQLSAEFEARQPEVDEVVASYPSAAELRELEREWQALQAKHERLRSRLTDRATQLNQNINTLITERNTWQNRLTQIQADPTLTALGGRLSTSVSELQRTQEKAQDQLKSIVNLASQVEQQNQRVAESIQLIVEARSRIERSVFERDSNPLWRLPSPEQANGLSSLLRKPGTRDVQRLKEFANSRRGSLISVGIVFLLALLVALQFRQHVARWTSEGILATDGVLTFERPFSLALLAGLLMFIPLLPVAPAIAKSIFGLVFMVPLLRLLQPSLTYRHRLLLHTLLVTMLVTQACKLLTGPSTLRRILLALLALSTSVLISYLWKRHRQKNPQIKSRHFILAIALRVGVVVLVASFIANVIGYFSFSQMLSDGALIGAYYAVLLYAAKEVLLASTNTLLQTKTARKIAVINENYPRIIHWLRISLTIIANIFWLIATLNLFAVGESAFNLLSRALKFPISLGTLTFTAGDVVAFILIIAFGMVFASIVRAVLREDVLKRFNLQHGVPYAVSTVTYYLLLLIVFLAALASAGVELSRFTILTGAFGVGVGFGLQTTVNNFASGLILLFERPIRVHDILEVDGAHGEVIKIGMRATSLKTGEGAEVILPNSSLVANKVINWSRMGRRRRVILPIRVAYGTDPQRVIDLLVDIASNEPLIVREPKPVAFFNGFGVTALDFQLHFWVSQFQLHDRLRSEMAIRIASEFEKQGIQIPFKKFEPTDEERELNTSAEDIEMSPRVKGRAL